MVAHETADGKWIRLQASFETLQERLATALGMRQDASELAAAIRKHQGEELEQMLVDAKCKVAIARTHEEWMGPSRRTGRGCRADLRRAGWCCEGQLVEAGAWSGPRRD
jgi:hypothetical protein